MARYLKREVIGRGANGVVYQGFDTWSGWAVAIKEVHLRDDLEKLRSEVQLMSRLSHEHIVTYYGAELRKGVLLIYQEWVPNGSVDSLLSVCGTFEEPVIRSYAVQVAKGLAYLHDQKIMHRDIKGGNVLVSEKGVAKLSDFGTSMMLADVTTAAGAKTLCGTPYYMAPEVMKGEVYGRKADVWSFGGLVLQMATGSPPWKSLNFQSIPQLLLHVVTVNSPPPLADDLSAQLKRFIMRCFELDQERRPTAAEILEDPFLAADRVMSPKPSPKQNPVANPYARSRTRSTSSSTSPTHNLGQHSRPASASNLVSMAASENFSSDSLRPPRLHIASRSVESALPDVAPSGSTPPMRSPKAARPPRTSPRNTPTASPKALRAARSSTRSPPPAPARTAEDEAFDELVRTLPDGPANTRKSRSPPYRAVSDDRPAVDEDFDEDLIPIESAYEKGLLDGKEYQRRIQRLQGGDKAAGFFRLAPDAPPVFPR